MKTSNIKIVDKTGKSEPLVMKASAIPVGTAFIGFVGTTDFQNCSGGSGAGPYLSTYSAIVELKNPKNTWSKHQDSEWTIIEVVDLEITYSSQKPDQL
jgi:hypothetical protein